MTFSHFYTANLSALRSVFGLYVAWRWRHQSKSEFLASNRTQKGKSFVTHATYAELSAAPLPPENTKKQVR